MKKYGKNHEGIIKKNIICTFATAVVYHDNLQKKICVENGYTHVKNSAPYNKDYVICYKIQNNTEVKYYWVKKDES